MNVSPASIILRNLKKISSQYFLPTIVFMLGFSLFIVFQVVGEKISFQEFAQASDSDSRSLEVLFKNLNLKLLDGSNFEFKSSPAQLVVVNFWASWCQPCLKEIPSLVALSNNFSKGQLEIIGINSDSAGDLNKVKKVLQKFKVKYGIYLDQNESLTDKFKIDALPFTLVFYKGKLFKTIKKEFNFMNEDFLKELNELQKNK